jgi:hypothetical protein
MHVAELKIREFWASSNWRFFGVLSEHRSARHIPSKVDSRAIFRSKSILL